MVREDGAPRLSEASDYGIDLSLISLTTERIIAESASIFRTVPQQHCMQKRMNSAAGT
jgi:hypothetical protein